MQAGELWWEGKAAALSVRLDKMMPAVLRSPIRAVASSGYRPPLGDREGGAWRVDHIRAVEDTIAYANYWKVCMETSIAAIEAAERAQASINKLRSVVDGFRAAIKNDIASMKAASERVQTEVTQMKDQYKQAQDTLTSPAFLQAIENAERMARALQAIQGLTDTKVSVAVFGGGK